MDDRELGANRLVETVYILSLAKYDGHHYTWIFDEENVTKCCTSIMQSASNPALSFDGDDAAHLCSRALCRHDK